jgi:hypothetical protein
MKRQRRQALQHRYGHASTDAVARARSHYQAARARLRAALDAVGTMRQFPPDLLSKITPPMVRAEREYDAATKELNKRIAILRKASHGMEP